MAWPNIAIVQVVKRRTAGKLTIERRIIEDGRELVAQQIATLTAGMYLVGCLYILCDTHRSLRRRLWITPRRYRWVQLTPAMAAGLTDHIWSAHELFWFRVPPPPWVPPKYRGRRSKETLQLIETWCQSVHA